MQQRWWVIVVAVIGVALAVVLFPRPDTGAALTTEGGAAEVAAGNVPGVRAVNPNLPPGWVKPPPAAPGIETLQPGEAERIADRSRPESVYASKLVSPFSAIRYTLAREGKDAPAAKALMDEIGTLMTDLREVRVDPDSRPWPELVAKTDAMIAKVEGSEWGKADAIVKAVERYHAFLQEYEVAKSAPVQNPAPAAPSPMEAQ